MMPMFRCLQNMTIQDLLQLEAKAREHLSLEDPKQRQTTSSDGSQGSTLLPGGFSFADIVQASQPQWPAIWTCWNSSIGEKPVRVYISFQMQSVQAVSRLYPYRCAQMSQSCPAWMSWSLGSVGPADVHACPHARLTHR